MLQSTESTESTTAVGSNAISKAANLTSLTFAAPESIQTLAECALANCPTLESVNGAQSVGQAIAVFANADIGGLVFFNTGLMGDMEETTSAIELASAGGPAVTVTTDVGTYYTGEGVETAVSLKNTVEGSTDKLRIYFSFSDSEGTFGFELKDHVFEGDTTKKQYTVTAGKMNGSNIYYLELPAIDPSDTISFSITNLYKSPTTDGGDMTIWAEVIPGDGTQTVPETTTCHKITWITVPETFTVSKRMSGSAQLYGTGEENGVLSLRGLKYAITMASTKTAPTNKGKDFVKSVDFTDVITLPNGMSWSEEVLEIVRSGSWSYSRSGS